MRPQSDCTEESHCCAQSELRGPSGPLTAGKSGPVIARSVGALRGAVWVRFHCVVFGSLWLVGACNKKKKKERKACTIVIDINEEFD